MNNDWNIIYKNNRRLDEIFYEKYSEIEPDYFRKNAIEFLVELGEFVNETKCFKYWSIKKPNKEDVLEEFADTITMCLYFLGDLDSTLDDIPEHIESNDVLEVLNYLFNKGSYIMIDYNELLMKDIFSNLLYVGKLLDLKEEEIIKAIDKKHIKIEERLNSDY